jgi:hypothetical protein
MGKSESPRRSPEGEIRCTGLHSFATFCRVAIPDLRDTKGVRVEHAKRWPWADVESTRPIVFLIATRVTGFSLPNVVAHNPPTFRMARLSKFFNAPIAKSRRFPPELQIRKADKKSQKKEKFARRGAS